MNTYQDNHRCEQNTSLYIRKDLSKKLDRTTTNCRKPRFLRTCNCCLLPPVITNCTNPRENIICPKTKVCEKVKDACNKNYYLLTTYGKELSSRKLMEKCICTKFNGLQDRCEHSGCFNKARCLNNPFPICQPAVKWKIDKICKENIPDKCQVPKYYIDH